MNKKYTLKDIVKASIDEDMIYHGEDILIEKVDKQKLMDELYAKYKDCIKCELGKTRLNLVFGEGDVNANLMFIGEGPGFEEDHLGKPFVGKSGELLTKIINAIDLTREKVYIANIVKCHPMIDPTNPEKQGNNRKPNDNEIAVCNEILLKQIEIIGPKIICTLGAVAIQSLLKTKQGISSLRGKEYKYKNSIVIPTFHPSYLLRDETKKKDAWNDMKKIRAKLQSS